MGAPGPNVTRICKICGSEFNPKSSRQQCCNKPIQVPCVICGKLMEQICTAKQKKTCSKECNNIYIKQCQIESGNKLTKICKWCGKEFHPKYIRENYCSGSHYQVCEVCGKQFEIDLNRYADRKTCSEECRYILANRDKDIEAMKTNLQATLLEKYGVTNAMHIPGSKEKIKQTNLTKYGKEYYTQTEEYHEQVKQTDLAKYGVEHHLASQQIRDKRKETINKKYGADNVFQLDEVKEKSRITVLEKYDVTNVSQSPEIHRRKALNKKNNIAPDGKVFDSSYELLFYLFLLKLPDIKIDTQVPIEYNGHVTLIDFRVNDILFEVKGSHLLNGVFNAAHHIEDKLQVYEDHKVIIITDTLSSISPIVDNDLFGINIDLFRNDSIAPERLWNHILSQFKNNYRGFIDTIL